MSGQATVLLEHHLKFLKLPTMKNEYDVIAARCAKDNSDYATYLLRLAEREVIERQHRAMQRRIKDARFPILKTIDTQRPVAGFQYNGGGVNKRHRFTFAASCVRFARVGSFWGGGTWAAFVGLATSSRKRWVLLILMIFSVLRLLPSQPPFSCSQMIST